MIKLIAETKKINQVFSGKSEHGKSTIIVVCPFCNYSNEVYSWSFSACGKKCDGNGCKSHLNRFSGAELTINVTDSQYEIMKDLKSFIVSQRDCGWMPSKRSLNSLIKKGLISLGVYRDGNITEYGYFLTDLGHKCLKV